MAPSRVFGRSLEQLQARVSSWRGLEVLGEVVDRRPSGDRQLFAKPFGVGCDASRSRTADDKNADHLVRNRQRFRVKPIL
jgi:hypothetical protein